MRICKTSKFVDFKSSSVTTSKPLHAGFVGKDFDM